MTIGRCNAPAIMPAMMPNRPARGARVVQNKAARSGPGSACSQMWGKTGKIDARHDRQDVAGMLSKSPETCDGEDTCQGCAVQISLNQKYIGEADQSHQPHIHQCCAEVGDDHIVGSQASCFCPQLFILRKLRAPNQTEYDQEQHDTQDIPGQESGIFRRPVKR